MAVDFENLPPININVPITSAGAQLTPPAVLWANLINAVAAVDPGYTILPAGLIEDIASTDTYAIALQDSAVVELINSISPRTANAWLLRQLGIMYGVAPVVQSNTSVFVVFTGTPGFQVNPGFIVSDGTTQYQVQDGGSIGQASIGPNGTTQPLFCLALTPGSFPVPEGTVDQLITSVPTTITLACNNPQDGTPSAAPQTEEQYRALVIAAGLVSGQGNASMAKTLLANVPGVQARLISVVQVNGGGWEVVCGGGDPYQVAGAIYESGLDISTLVGSTIHVTGASNTNPCVITTDLNSGFANGQTGVVIAGAFGLTAINGTWTVTTTGLPPNQFSIPLDATSQPAWTSGGVVTPNARNISVNLNDYPDVYTIPFVNPPAQVVTIQLTWNTISPNFVSDVGVQQLGAPAISSYVNNIPVGAPINVFELQAVFQAAVETLVPAPLLTRMLFTVSIDGFAVTPEAGTGIVPSDPESFFTCAPTSVTITQG